MTNVNQPPCLMEPPRHVKVHFATPHLHVNNLQPSTASIPSYVTTSVHMFKLSYPTLQFPYHRHVH
jgi:hypothetical protein